MAVFCLSKLDAYFLTIIAGIDNTERVASDFSNAMASKSGVVSLLKSSCARLFAGNFPIENVVGKPKSKYTVVFLPLKFLISVSLDR